MNLFVKVLILVVASTTWVSQCVLSMDNLKDYADTDWKTHITIRSPLESEKFPSFTTVKIQKLNFTPSDNELEMAQLERDLAHIYYYYVHG